MVLMGKGLSEVSIRPVLSKDSVIQSLSLIVDSAEVCSVLSTMGAGIGAGTDSMAV